ncbi:hypothetical protein HBH56_239460 [Parastagonospora nodorum]|uniref:Uncharacterized protein n=1 Tax=Phaeosphaeria nodorum (strain SN15 / ATCC MYA-4574 / FGSC 10173) TaxID=321614 RepID=A0A7U2ID42_PHANO|nr:hypothetical protein HBH56_239460 [Parastagonospora nodorum]QRD07600.1 hypothetical protein JI435_447740 [Parastagonospora nodorum SN15]KAH3921584.1 hypothetical protein HBH54_236600 [Parastagonospora nodorum]KAH3939756.1 hypothetical protein HBH53_228520 [Parastagonospora nodorum]KAH3994030.1 hypothetical protein HBI10_191810 [Parastagonospora nodorum]
MHDHHIAAAAHFHRLICCKVLLTAALVTARFTVVIRQPPAYDPILKTAIGITRLFKLGFCIIVEAQRGTEQPTAQMDNAVIFPPKSFESASYMLPCISPHLRAIMWQYKCDISPCIGRFGE